MGISFSCPFTESFDLETGFESVIVNSICFGNDEVKTTMRSISFNNHDNDSTIMKTISSDGKMTVEGAISFKRTETNTMISIVTPSSETPNILFTDNANAAPQLPLLDHVNSEHEAALKLQKVYKSFRTRRKLADCAVLVEQSWWKLLDFAELKRSSISFFEIEKHETAISRWSRAKNRAAKVGKGLSKNGKARQLALQHWLEAIDPRHRYGHNLHFYYAKWLDCQSREPFFYWLDIGEGKEVNLVEKCPRTKLQLHCIKYLGPKERKTYEVVVEDGKLMFLQTGEFLDTTGGPKEDKWIYVLSTSQSLYVGKKKKGTFQHSSFLAGGATTCAGRLVVENGILKAIWPHSGHYQPTQENFKDFISYLEENNVDLTDVKMSPVEDEEGSLNKLRSSVGLRRNLSDEDLILNMTDPEIIEISNVNMTFERPKSRWSQSFSRTWTSLDIPNKRELFAELETERRAVESLFSGYETAEEAFVSNQEETARKQNLSDEEHEAKLTDSHEGLNSFHRGRQLSRRWSSGTGLRIGCVGQSPSQLQIRALEHVSLSPRSTQHTRIQPSPFFIRRK